MGRHKSAAKKRSSGNAKPHAEPNTPPVAAPPSVPLKSLLRVRLPPTAWNGTIMSVYSPEAIDSTSTAASKSSSGRRVRIVVAGESVGKNKHRVRDDDDDNRVIKERRLSDAASTRLSRGIVQGK